MAAKKTIKPPNPLPRTVYLKCVDDASQPAGYVGDWPVASRVYAATIKPSVHSGVPHAYLHGFYSQSPWGAFAVARFVVVADVWLN